MSQSTYLTPATALLLMVAQSNVFAQVACADKSAACNSDLRVIENPKGLIDGKNAIFTLSLTPASPLHVLVFKSGFPLTNGIAFKVADRQVQFPPSDVPQPGESVTVVYLPASTKQLKGIGSSFAPGAFGATGGADIAALGLREALDLESRPITNKTLPAGESKQSKALIMMGNWQKGDRGRQSINPANPLSAESREGLVSRPEKRHSSEAPMRGERDGGGSSNSKALQLLKDRTSTDSPGTPPVAEERQP